MARRLSRAFLSAEGVSSADWGIRLIDTAGLAERQEP